MQTTELKLQKHGQLIIRRMGHLLPMYGKRTIHEHASLYAKHAIACGWRLTIRQDTSATLTVSKR